MRKPVEGAMIKLLEYFWTGSTGFWEFALVFLPSRTEERKHDPPSAEKRENIVS